MELKKQFRCARAHIGLVHNEQPGANGMETAWGIIVTSCGTKIGQQVREFEDYNKCVKEYNFLKELTGGIEV